MKNYFTISEFARLREIDINSLRYYEKLGILKPAYIDRETKYRYYSAEQLSMLDVILLSINLGIPLKQLKNYIDENGNFQHKEFVEEGKRLTEERMRQLQNNLCRIEHTLQYLEDTSKYSKCEGIYTRTFPERYLITEEHQGSLDDIKAVEKTFSALFSYAREQKMNPIMPTGILFQYKNSSAKKYICWEITDSKAHDEKIMKLPAADYSCVQIDWDIARNIQETVESTFEIGNQAFVFASNMLQSRFRFGTKVGELQLLMFDGMHSDRHEFDVAASADRF